jgi:ABC-type transport system involved in cytochrome bd biosynthesis fused ATPase/permease subunit
MSMHSTEPTNPGSAEPDYMTDTRPIAAGETGPGCKKRDPIVVAENVTRSFGGINAVDVAYLEIPRHKITALIGPNGAGKTTLFNLLTGFDTPNTGKWQFEGKSIAGVSPYKVARMGMVRTFQLTKVMGKLTVMENMRLGAANQPGKASPRLCSRASGEAARNRSRPKPMYSSRSSSWIPKRTTTPPPCPAASASSSKWHAP